MQSHVESPVLLRRSIFLGIIVVVLGITALLKVYSAAMLGGAEPRDPVLWLFPSKREALLFGATLELIMVYLLTRQRHNSIHDFGLVFVLSCGFLGYRISNLVFYQTFGCSCAGILSTESALIGISIEVLLFVFVIYMMLGSLFHLRRTMIH